MPDAWMAAVAATGMPGEQTYPFIYLPWVAAVMAPIARNFAPQNVMNAALLLNCALMIWSVFLARRIMAPKETPLWLWVGISFVILFTSAASVLALALGQVQILVITCCLFAFERYRAGFFWAAGAALAVAACLKITPAAFVIVFVWDRNWRALLGFALVCAIVGTFSLFAVGIPLHLQYFGLMQKLSDQVFIASIAFSVEGFVFQIWDYVNGTAPIHVTNEYIYPKPPWIDHIAKAAFLTGLIAIWMKTRRLGDDQKLGRQILTLSILIPLTAPLGWIHYFLLTAYLLPGLLEHMNRKLAIGLIVLFGISLSAYTMLALILPGLKVMPQIILCVPVLTLILVATIVFGYRREDAQHTQGLEILPAE
ncbi:MAG: glycosyltransferase family 87 protein [Marinosulfonomonas sp.]